MLIRMLINLAPFYHFHFHYFLSFSQSKTQTQSALNNVWKCSLCTHTHDQPKTQKQSQKMFVHIHTHTKRRKIVIGEVKREANFLIRILELLLWLRKQILVETKGVNSEQCPSILRLCRLQTVTSRQFDCFCVLTTHIQHSSNKGRMKRGKS